MNNYALPARSLPVGTYTVEIRRNKINLFLLLD